MFILEQLYSFLSMPENSMLPVCKTTKKIILKKKASETTMKMGFFSLPVGGFGEENE